MRPPRRRRHRPGRRSTPREQACPWPQLSRPAWSHCRDAGAWRSPPILVPAMTDLPPHQPDLDALAASLRLDARDTAFFSQVLATRLPDSMPAIVTLDREGGMFKKDHRV